MGEIGGILRLIRPVNCTMMGFAVVVGAAIGGGPGFLGSWLSLVLGFVTGFTLTGGAMAVNDFYDREIDAINEPERPIPSGVVTPREALAVFLALSAMGLLAASGTNMVCLVIAVFSWLAMFLYSAVGKRTGLPGNLLVSACIAMPFMFGGAAVENRLSAPTLLFALMAFLSNTGREVTKGIVDVEGDRSQGIRTVAVSRGGVTAAWTAALFYLSAAALSALPLSLRLVSQLYVPFVTLTDLGLIHSSYSLVRDAGRENSRRVKNRVLIWMTSGLVGFLVGGFLRG